MREEAGAPVTMTTPPTATRPRCRAAAETSATERSQLPVVTSNKAGTTISNKTGAVIVTVTAGVAKNTMKIRAETVATKITDGDGTETCKGLP